MTTALPAQVQGNRGLGSGPDSSCCNLDYYPCPALLFDSVGQLLTQNSRAADIYAAHDTGKPVTLQQLAPGADVKQLTTELVNGLRKASLQFQHKLNGKGPTQWLLCQASRMQHPDSGEPCVMVVQVDITDAKQMCHAAAASEERAREQMQALQRKLLRAVTENEALRHVVDKLQCNVLALRRQMQAEGIMPEAELDDSLLAPSPHQEIYAAMVAGMGSTNNDDPQSRFDGLSAFEGEVLSHAATESIHSQQANQVHFLQDIQDLQKANARLQLAKEQAAWDAAIYKAKYDKALVDAVDLKQNFDSLEAQHDRLATDACTNKAEYEKLAADLVEQQDQLNKAAADAAEYKSGFDKVLADNCEQQAQMDKMVADGAEREAELMKATADAVEYKASFDKLMVDTAEQKAELEKTTADAAEYKAGFDKYAADAAEYKAGFDKYAADAAEYKAGFDRAVADSAVQKAQYDKLVVDSAEHKAQLDKAAADACEYKAGWDKLLVDTSEQKAMLDKAAADACEYKAGWDKLLVDTSEQKAMLDKAAADACEYKAGWDKLLVDSAEQKAQYDQMAEDSIQQKAQLDKATTDAAEYKAGFDKLAVKSARHKAMFDKISADAVEGRAMYDKLLADNTEQKAQYDKLIVDSAEQKAQFDKDAAEAAADAAHYKAGFDKLLVDSAEQKAQWDKAAADAAEYKADLDQLMADSCAQEAQYAKMVADSAEQKAQYDRLLVDNYDQKAQFDKLAVDSSEQKAQYDKLLVDTSEQKAQFDKLFVDSAEQKAQYDKAAADATEYKAGFDKLMVDATEQKAQYDKASADAAEYKASFDKLYIDSAEQKAQLDKAAADATEYKAGFDKLMVDAAEQKAQLDKLALQASADAADYKASFDKLYVDSAEQKAQLDKASADAAEYKAGFDKVLVDAAVQKAQLDKATADATEYKAGFDKLMADSCEQAAVFNKLVADSTEQKAQYDKLAADSSEQKAMYDKVLVDTAEQKAQLDKATADAAEYKAGYDKVIADTAEQKSQLDKVAADAAEYKAGFDKYAADAAEFKAGFDKAVADGATQKAEYDKLVQDSALLKVMHDDLEVTAKLHKMNADKALNQMNKMVMDMSQVQQQLDREREKVNSLQSTHMKLLHHQEVLQAELEMALGSYRPKTCIDAGTPADKLLTMMTELLDGSLPNLQDILMVQSTILESRDIYQPFRLGKQLLEAKDLEESVGLSLVHLLGDTATLSENAPMSLEELCNRRSRRAQPRELGSFSSLSASSSSSELDTCEPAFTNLHNALSSIIEAPNSRQLGQGGPGSTSISRASHSLHQAIRRPNAPGSQFDNTEPGSSDMDTAYEEDANTMPSMPPPPLPIMDDLEAVLATAEEWQFDAFALANVSCGHALSSLGYYLFHRHDLISHFKINPVLLARFLRRMEEGYKMNPYHNSTHAADVLQTLNVMIHRGGLAPGYVDPLHLMACYTAAVLHDFEHGGLTNDYLVNSMDKLAILYNDRSPLENHHLAAAFTIMCRPEYAFLNSLTKPELDKFRKSVIELVLATDMKQHFSILSHFTTVHRLNAAGTVTPSGSSVDIGAVMRSRRSETSSAHNSMCGGDEKIVLPLDENERLLSLQMALKCADLGHVTASLPLHSRWVSLLEEEFFRQGDVEKLHGLPVSPLFDRSKQGITKSQIGFFDIVVIPLYHTYGKVFSSCKPLLTYVMRNYRHWTDVQHQQACSGMGN